MTFSWKDDVLACDGALAVDDAEALLQELAQRAGSAASCADLSGCGHVHAACLQVLMAAGVRIVAWPPDAALGAWLRAALPAPACAPERYPNKQAKETT
ncbi:hypothetical protein [Massilia sp. BSC265]|uniref:hypothetical protein n=1 Tax=Massilia sp. BSC265 TaxID=1549812 RepID=UPI00068D3C56|nr:hypothetical protein [Massilia sp. BSC265]